MAEGEIFRVLDCYYSRFSLINIPTVVLLMGIDVASLLRVSPQAYLKVWA